MHKELNKKDIASFLHFGYVPKAKPVHLDKLFDRYNIALNPVKSAVPENESIETGIAILDATFKDIAKQVGATTVVIPISGGMDSRAILAGMLKHLPKTQIRTVTLGIPGALDYEIGQQVARVAGLANKAINLNDLEWKEDALLAYAAKFHSPIAFMEGYLFSQVFTDASGSEIFLSGFMGDPLAGSHLSAEPTASWKDARANFVLRNNFANSSLIPHKDDMSHLPKDPICSPELLTMDEQLDFFIRQRHYIQPLVLLKGYRHMAPFLAPDWINFILNLPHDMRFQQTLYKQILAKAYPVLFSLPLKNESGLPLTASRCKKLTKRCIGRLQKFANQCFPQLVPKPIKHLNYIDFEKSYRTKTDLKAFAERYVKDLAQRNVVLQLDIRKTWQDHQAKTRNNAQLLNLLVSLELFYKSRGV